MEELLRQLIELDKKSKQVSLYANAVDLTSKVGGYASEVNNLVSYLNDIVLNEDVHVLFIHRDNAEIKYGEFNKGFKDLKGIIHMQREDDLKSVYCLIQNEFGENFKRGSKHTFGKGWSLLASISENVLVDIDSNRSSDSNWIFEECHINEKNR